MSGGQPDRVPALPKIWVDFSARYLGLQLRAVIEDPKLAMNCVIRTALALGMDASRTFCFPSRVTAVDGNEVIEADSRGRRVGRIDITGGLSTHYDQHDKRLIEDVSRTAFINFYKSERPWIADMDDVRRFAVPPKSFYHEAGYAGLLRSEMEQAGDEIALLGNCEAISLGFAASVCGVENALMDLIGEPEFIHAVMDIGDRIAIERGKFHIDLGFRILRLNDSVANMSVISPAHWREFIQPHFQTVCSELKNYCPGIKIYSHICGNTLPILPDLAATGIDCLGPIDPMAGYDCRRAREAVGPDISLHGGVNTLSFLGKSEEDLVAEALTCIEGAGCRGFVLGSGCSIPRGARPENVAALRKASILSGYPAACSLE